MIRKVFLKNSSEGVILRYKLYKNHEISILIEIVRFI